MLDVLGGCHLLQESLELLLKNQNCSRSKHHLESAFELANLAGACHLSRPESLLLAKATLHFPSLIQSSSDLKPIKQISVAQTPNFAPQPFEALCLTQMLCQTEDFFKITKLVIKGLGMSRSIPEPKTPLAKITKFVDTLGYEFPFFGSFWLDPKELSGQDQVAVLWSNSTRKNGYFEWNDACEFVHEWGHLVLAQSLFLSNSSELSVPVFKREAFAFYAECCWEIHWGRTQDQAYNSLHQRILGPNNASADHQKGCEFLLDWIASGDSEPLLNLP